MKRTQVQLTAEQVQRLRELSAARGVSMAEVVREAVDLLVRGTPVIPWEERRRRALEAVGRFTSGRKDISARHDEYLEEAYGPRRRRLR